MAFNDDDMYYMMDPEPSEEKKPKIKHRRITSMTNFKLNDYVLVKETGKKDFIKRIYKDLEGTQYLEFDNDIKAYSFDDVLLLEQPQEEQTERFPSDNEAGGGGYGPADENEMVSVEKEPAAVERVGEKAAEEEYDESLDESIPVDEEENELIKQITVDKVADKRIIEVQDINLLIQTMEGALQIARKFKGQ